MFFENETHSHDADYLEWLRITIQGWRGVNPTLADEIVAEVGADLARNFPRPACGPDGFFERGLVNPRNWLLKRAKLVRKRLRSDSHRQRQHCKLIESDELSRLPAPLPRMDPVEDSIDDGRAHERQLANIALAALSPPHRNLIETCVLGRLSVPDYAREIGRPISTVRSWLRRALKQLRRAHETGRRSLIG